MDKYSFFVGIDVSKLKLDISIINGENRKHQKHFIVKNNRLGILEMVKQVHKLTCNEKVLFCFENTGIYSAPLCFNLSDLKRDYWEVPAIEINKSKGITRGKSDKNDSKDIALYASTHLHKLRINQIPSEDVLKIKMLNTERGKLIKAIKQLATTQEIANFYPKKVISDLLKSNRKVVNSLKKALKTIENKIDEIVQSNTIIANQNKLIQSIPGVGKQTAINLITTTNCFTKFSTWRKVACYAGVAPFEYSSGTSIKGRTKVNHYADKNLKSLLNMCALSAKKYDPQIKQYFERKVSEGKSKMLVLNNIRAKLLSRIFAVINRNSSYINTLKYAA